MSRKSRRSRGNAGSDEDSDDGPPPDPDEPPPVQITSKKEKKPLEVKEVQVSARKAGDDKGNLQGGLSAVRREMLLAIRAEEDEVWEDLDFCDGEVFLFFSFPFSGWMLIIWCRLLKDKKYLKLCFRKMRSIWNVSLILLLF